MKIVGKTDNGFLVQISETEIGIVAGFGRYPRYDDKRKEEFISLLRTNVEIPVVVGLEYITKVSDRIKSARKAADELRELADMLDSAVPELFIPEVQS